MFLDLFETFFRTKFQICNRNGLKVMKQILKSFVQNWRWGWGGRVKTITRTASAVKNNCFNLSSLLSTPRRSSQSTCVMFNLSCLNFFSPWFNLVLSKLVKSCRDPPKSFLLRNSNRLSCPRVSFTLPEGLQNSVALFRLWFET